MKFDKTKYLNTKIGVLLIIDAFRKDSQTFFTCKCTCGNTITKSRIKIIRMRFLKCCKEPELINGKRKFSMSKHNMYLSSEYSSCKGMRDRCFSENCKQYNNYGSRGIIVCDRWKNSFENFIADMGEKPSKGYSVERINNNGNYEPDNCRWATQKEQMANTSRTKWVILNDKKMMFTFAIKQLGVSMGSIYYRINKGMTPQQAINDYCIKYNIMEVF